MNIEAQERLETSILQNHLPILLFIKTLSLLGIFDVGFIYP